MAAVAAPGQAGGLLTPLRASFGVAVATFVVLRLLLSLTAASALAAHPVVVTPGIHGQYVGIRPDPNPLLAPWQRFDTPWYQRIAERGYRPGDGSTAFRPLFPLLIRLVSLATGNTLLAALAIANVCFVLLIMMVHNLAWQVVGGAAALRATVLYALFPCSFFLLVGYSESLFVLCCAAALLAGYRGHWGWAGLAGLAAALTRNQGGLLVLPLAMLYWRARPRGGSWRSALPLLLPLAGAAVFPVYTALVVHAPPIAEVEASQWSNPISPPWVTLGRLIDLIRAPHWHLINSPSGNYIELWNLICAVVFAVLIVAAARRVGAVLTVYNALQWIAALSLLYSTSRYMLPLFPAYFAVGAWLAGRRLLFDLLLAVSLACYLFLAGQFALWSWVA